MVPLEPHLATSGTGNSLEDLNLVSEGRGMVKYWSVIVGFLKPPDEN